MVSGSFFLLTYAIIPSKLIKQRAIATIEKLEGQYKLQIETEGKT